MIVDHIRDEEQSTSAHFIKISYDDTLKDETLTMTLNVYVEQDYGAMEPLSKNIKKKMTSSLVA